MHSESYGDTVTLTVQSPSHRCDQAGRYRILGGSFYWTENAGFVLEKLLLWSI